MEQVVSTAKKPNHRFYWVFGSFFVDILPRQTEKFWNWLGIFFADICFNRHALISHCYPKWDIDIWCILLPIAALYLYVGPTLNALQYSQVYYSECSTLYSRVSRSKCPTWYGCVPGTKCPTPCKCAFLHVDTIQSLASYKKLTPVGAVVSWWTVL